MVKKVSAVKKEFLIFIFREADYIMIDFALLPWLAPHGWRCEWMLRCLVRDLMSAESVDDTSAGVSLGRIWFEQD